MPLPSLVRLFALAALWGAAFMFMRVIVPVLGPMPTAFGRVLLGALGLLALLAVWRVPLAFGGKLRATLALGAINSGVPFAMYALAAQVLPAGYSAILNATTPLMGVVIGAVAFGERLTAAKLGGVLLGLGGVALLTRTGPVTLTPAVLGGVAACLVATFCYGLAGFLTRRWIGAQGGLDSRLVALGSQLGAVLLLAPLAGWPSAGQTMAVLGSQPKVMWSLLALGLLCTSLAYVLYFRLIADIGPLKSLTVTFLIPLFAIFWGWLLLGEPVTLAHALGGGLIGLALVLVMWPAPPRAASQAT